MSLPKAFENDDAYFKAATEFLKKYSWVFSEANTSCIKALDLMPQVFKDYFLNAPNESLNAFPYVTEPLDYCPTELQDFRLRISQLTPEAITATALVRVPRKSNNLNRKIGQKKLHEIEQLAANIHEHSTKDATQVLVDLGSGLGYLSEALLELNDNYLILGLEADEQRVISAQQRCKKLLPQKALNSISYRQEFISATPKSRDRIEAYTLELLQSSGLSPELSTISIAIIGLHACADLSVSAMRLFLTMPQVRSLHIMPCCYHKLALREGVESSASCPFVNFPLSNGLNKTAAKLPECCFNRPFLRLACQETRSRWRKDSPEHAKHGHQMYLRALANALCDDPDELVKLHSKDASLSHKDILNFEGLCRRYRLHSRVTGQPLSWRLIHGIRFSQINERYSEGRGSRLAEALCCLQASMQKLCENLLLYDRLCFLKEAAAEQRQPLEVRYEQLFDEQVSPRCQVLIAKKL
ncbi:hypothetical protein KR093_004212 [Drosophila rubida]|uniref:Methyltransferase domain-containing protein n=1 Tax=Drosophila rubida TaxID=30044 RepID=A0AAD4JR78_9MUSC|nr:hypothetical protein KR093_004212 [Drosophila rubida]